MDSIKSFLVKFGGHLLGAGLIVGGWWISMLNMAIDRFSTNDYWNFWTVTGLIMIFIGAYIPTWVAKLHTHKRKKRDELRAKEAEAAAQAATEQSAAQAGAVPPEGS